MLHPDLHKVIIFSLCCTGYPLLSISLASIFHILPLLSRSYFVCLLKNYCPLSKAIPKSQQQILNKDGDGIREVIRACRQHVALSLVGITGRQWPGMGKTSPNMLKSTFCFSEHFHIVSYVISQTAGRHEYPPCRKWETELEKKDNKGSKVDKASGQQGLSSAS